MMNPARKLLSWVVEQQSSAHRFVHTTPACMKKSAGRYKISLKRDKPLTYEMANPPHYIAHRKAWNSWNCSSLAGGLRTSETGIEDMFIRRFMIGTFHDLLVSEIIIKRQFNHIRIAAIARRGLPPRKFYFLIGYTEELLAIWLQCPVTLELQTTEKREDTVFKYI